MPRTLSDPALERIAELRAALELEASEARRRDQALFEGSSKRTLEADGLLLRRARVQDQRPALFGRVRVDLGEDPSRPGHFESFGARVGDSVRILASEPDADELHGVVIGRRRAGISIVVDQPIEDDELDLVVSRDEVTLRRLKDSLDEVARSEKRTAELAEILLGVAQPKVCAPREGLSFFDAELDESQRAAVGTALASPDVALVHGPFGTGKTRVLVEVARQAIASGERVLAVAASNAAVDHLALSILRADPEAPIVRLGHPGRVTSELLEHTLSAQTESHERRKLARGLVQQALELRKRAEKRSRKTPKEAHQARREARDEAKRLLADARTLERQAVDDILDRSRVVLGTLTGAPHELPSRMRFDRLIVDEASQATTPALLGVIDRADRVVLAGDHKQLPPTVLSLESSRVLGSTAFERLMEADPNDSYSKMLRVQRRMHAGLMRFPSSMFYRGELSASPDVAGIDLEGLGVAEGLFAYQPSLEVVDTAGAGFDETFEEGGVSRENPGQARVVVGIVRDFVECGVPAAAIGVVSPYSAQVAAIARNLSDLSDLGLEIDSVDAFQGREKEVIVFDAVRSNGELEIGFLNDLRRLNVALTRAKRKLVIVADSATLSSNPVWARLFQFAELHGRLSSVFSFPMLM